MTASLLTTLFVAFLVAMLVLQSWLSWRHLDHIIAHRAEVPAEFAQDITLTAHQKAADYAADKIRIGLMEGLLDVVVLLFFTLGGGLVRIDHLLGNWLGSGYWRGLALIFSLTVISSLISLPFTLYRTFVIEAKYGFNKMTFKLYLLDTLKGIALGVMLGVPLLLVVFWLMEKMGSLWWLYTWLVWLAFSLGMMAIFPNFIAPLFNKFTPLTDDSLRQRIEALLARCGFTSSGLFVMDGSKRSSHGNAYFTGFGKTKRIVFFDTLIERLTPAEIEA
ncbi:MAG: M48 family metallopeptidase, partial [Betaproteobacteria bacterium]|nr:M48 family metallopeptidase [Betaproteobacteria bacterium]